MRVQTDTGDRGVTVPADWRATSTGHVRGSGAAPHTRQPNASRNASGTSRFCAIRSSRPRVAASLDPIADLRHQPLVRAADRRHDAELAGAGCELLAAATSSGGHSHTDRTGELNCPDREQK